jgi:hypothetical protein
MRLLVTFALFLTIPTDLKAADRWEIQYSFQQPQSSLVISDLKFPSAKRGIAAGYVLRNERTSPTVLITSDGGAHWTQIPFKEEPYSLFFLDDSLGWMVTEKGLWQTDEAGRTWKKLPSLPKGITKVCFLDRQHGWAVGSKMQAVETKDGGLTWRPIAALAEVKATPEFTTFQSVAFGNANFGIIAGTDVPPRRSEVPEWMDPQKAQNRRQLPTTLILLQTVDGGGTWKPSSASIFGKVTKISLTPGGDSLGLVEFSSNFEWPSEVYRFHAGVGESTRLYRQSDRFISDILLTESGASYLAGSEVTAVVRDNPIAGKLKIIRTRDNEHFEEMAVDYRAHAHRVFLAASPAKGLVDPEIWVATDTGTILKLVPGK